MEIRNTVSLLNTSIYDLSEMIIRSESTSKREIDRMAVKALLMTAKDYINDIERYYGIEDD